MKAAKGNAHVYTMHRPADKTKVPRLSCAARSSNMVAQPEQAKCPILHLAARVMH